MMAYSQRLSGTDEINAGDSLSIYKQNAGDWRGTAISLLQAYLQANLTFPTMTGMADFTKQYFAPGITGFTAVITNGGGNYWLILTPSMNFAAGAITLPALANLVDNQEVMVTCSTQITTLTINLNGASAIQNGPASLAAGDFFKLKYDASGLTWYRVG